MFDRFTDRAREVLKLAREEARKLNHSYMSTEHLLLGLFAEGKGVAATVLRTLKVDEGRIRDEIAKIVDKGAPEAAHGSLPFAPRGKKALEFAVEEAATLKHHYVGTEHLLLGLIREHEGVAAQALVGAGLKLEEVRNAVLEHVCAHTVGAAEEPVAEKAEQRDQGLKPSTKAVEESGYSPAVTATLMFSDELHREAWLAKNGFFDHPDPRRVQAKKLDYQRRRDSAQLFYKVGPLPASSPPASSEAFKPETF